VPQFFILPLFFTSNSHLNPSRSLGARHYVCIIRSIVLNIHVVCMHVHYEVYSAKAMISLQVFKFLNSSCFLVVNTMSLPHVGSDVQGVFNNTPSLFNNTLTL
jgi:hypothetical protein